MGSGSHYPEPFLIFEVPFHNALIIISYQRSPLHRALFILSRAYRSHTFGVLRYGSAPCYCQDNTHGVHSVKTAHVERKNDTFIHLV